MRLSLSPRIRWRQVDGEVVVVSQQLGEVMSLNETAGRILELVAPGTTWDAMVATLAREFDAPPTQIAIEARELVDELVRLSVIVEGPG